MISDVYFPRINGVSTSIQTFRADLASLGCETLLIAPQYAGHWHDDASTHRVAARVVPFDPEDRLMRLRDLKTIGRSLRGSFDLIHVHTPFIAHHAGVALARECGVPLIESYHTFFEEYFHHYLPFVPRRLLRPIARSISRVQCNAVDAVVSPSEPMAQVLRDYGVTTPVEVISTGLDSDDFERGDGALFRRRLGVDSDRPIVLHVGRVAFEKNIDFIIEMFVLVLDRVPDALLVIAGEGPALHALEARAKRLKIESSVMFLGYMDRKTVLLDCYRSANVFVFASNTETQGLVLLEAMAVGTPVVSTAVLGTKAVLAEAGEAAVVAREEKVEFGTAVADLLLDPSRQRRMGEAGHAYVQRSWSSRSMATKLMQLYNRLRQTRQPILHGR
jgi:glycosyltransferase involved in cell wall biosynthesis